MKKISTTILFIVFLLSTSIAQKLTLIPEAGVNFPYIKLNENPIPGLHYSSPVDGALGLRLNYQNKKGHGPFIGVGMGSYGYSFAYNGQSQSSSGSLLRLEAGYHWISKPVYFKRILDNGLSKEEFDKLKNKGWYFKTIPSAGLVYQRAGNVGWGSVGGGSFVSSSFNTNHSNMGVSLRTMLEFGKNDKPKFTLSFGYTLGFWDIEQIVAADNSLNKQAYFTSKGSSFGITLGIPITIWKKKK